MRHRLQKLSRSSNYTALTKVLQNQLKFGKKVAQSQQNAAIIDYLYVYCFFLYSIMLNFESAKF